RLLHADAGGNDPAALGREVARLLGERVRTRCCIRAHDVSQPTGFPWTGSKTRSVWRRGPWRGLAAPPLSNRGRACPGLDPGPVVRLIISTRRSCTPDWW